LWEYPDLIEIPAKTINSDFPVWMIHSLDKEAKRLGVPRQSVIKVWLAEKLDHELIH
jgi:hypothetical protein